MNRAQRLLLVAVMCCLAVGLPFYFLEYRQQWETAEQLFDHVRPPGLIVSLGESGGTKDTPHVTWNGIYARDAGAPHNAELFGLGLPALLIVGSVFLWLGRKSS